MAALKSYSLMGLELASFVTDWGQVEEVKEVLLASNQLFCSTHTLEVANQDNRFSQNNPVSPFYGRNIQLAPVVLSQDGVVLYEGFVRTITPNHQRRTASILAENSFTVPTNYFVNLTTAGNPAAIIRTILQQAGLDNYIDPISFTAALGGFAAAGATIGVNYVTTGAVNSANGVSGTTALAAIQAISSLCGLDCYVSSGLIRLKAFQAYQGNLSAVKYQITPEQVYDFGQLETMYENLMNSVNIGYGASSNYYAVNQASVNANGSAFGTLTKKTDVDQQFDGTTGNTLMVPNLTSAKYFAVQFLARASKIRQQADITAGPQLQQANIGDRVTVLAPNWSTSPIAFEIIEAHRQLQSQSVRLVLATI